MTQTRILAVGEEPPPLDSTPPDDWRLRNGEGRSKPKGKRVSAGRFQCINAFIDATMAALAPAERAVWLILWRDTKPNGLATTSQVSLARRAGVTDRAIRSAIKRLCQEGLLTVVRRGSLRGGSSVYRVHALSRKRDDRK
jgi:hypothetical protein